MKQKFISLGLLSFLLLILITTPHNSARKLASKQGEPNSKTNLIGINNSPITNLMGLEKCQEEDEECLKRRVLEEAHLDYIYTQDHNP